MDSMLNMTNMLRKSNIEERIDSFISFTQGLPVPVLTPTSVHAESSVSREACFLSEASQAWLSALKSLSE
jgi:hypothetical protein